MTTKLGLGSSSDVLPHLGKMATEWNDAMGKIGKDLDPDLIHAELNEKLQGRFLPLDFNQHCAMLEAHADRRRASRIPPGLTDEGKGNAERRGADTGNVDGDLALWLEVLDVASKVKPNSSATSNSGTDPAPAGYERVIIISQERKYDFIYAPVHRNPDADAPVGAVERIKNERPPVALVDPRLVSEFESRIGHRHVAFLNMESIADGWLRSNGTAAGLPANEIKEFVLALTQQNDKAEKKKAEAAAAEVNNETDLKPEEGTQPAPLPAATAPAPAPPPVSQRALLDIPEEAMKDEKNYVHQLPPGKYKDVLDSLNTHNWYVQNPAVLIILADGLPDDRGTAFVLGRAVYQAADGSAWRADKFLQEYNNWTVLADEFQQAFLAGAVYEALFTPAGERRDDPKTGNLQGLLGLLNLPKWEPAAHFISHQLQLADQTHYWLPGLPHPTIYAEVSGNDTAAGYAVTGIIIKADGFVDRQLCHAGPGAPQNISLTQLHEWIANCMLLPLTSITVTFSPPLPPQEKIIVGKDAILDPHTTRNPQRTSI